MVKQLLTFPYSRPVVTSWGAALAIIFFALFLRLFRLGSQGLFLDEAWSWAASRMDYSSIWRLLHIDPHPPLYFLLLKWFQAILPSSEFGLRLPSALFSTIAIALLLACAFQIGGARAALLAGWFAALSTFDLYYAQEARMYTLLGVLWLAAYVSSLQVLRGRLWFNWGWAFASILMAWTHFYGLLFALAFVAWAAYLLFRNVRQGSQPAPIYHAAGTIVSVLLLAAPIVPSLLSYSSNKPGGAWVPGAVDLVFLYGLITTGVSAATAHFINGNLLAVVDIPAALAAIIGTGACGLFAYLGLHRAWRRGGVHREIAGLTVWLLLGPIFIFGFLWILQKQQWALKVFLGPAYLIYLWAGIGLARQAAPVRWLVVGAYILLSLNTLVPYFSTWQKNQSPQTLGALPASLENQAIILERQYEAPVVFYYRPDLEKVLGIARRPNGRSQIVLIHPDGIAPEDQNVISCRDPAIQTTSSFWFFGNPNELQREFTSWPKCLHDKPVFIYINGSWSRAVY